jgi:hypothetical protein
MSSMKTGSVIWTPKMAVRHTRVELMPALHIGAKIKMDCYVMYHMKKRKK